MESNHLPPGYRPGPSPFGLACDDGAAARTRTEAPRHVGPVLLPLSYGGKMVLPDGFEPPNASM